MRDLGHFCKLVPARKPHSSYDDVRESVGEDVTERVDGIAFDAHGTGMTRGFSEIFV
jgi:hypothetical protein